LSGAILPKIDDPLRVYPAVIFSLGTGLFLLKDVTIPPMHEVDVVGRVKGVMNGTFEITSHSEDHQRSRRGSRGCWRVSNAVASVKNGLVTVRIANFSKMHISLANKRRIASTMPITKV
jgi:hypothetical protein